MILHPLVFPGYLCLIHPWLSNGLKSFVRKFSNCNSKAGNPYRSGRISTVDLLLLTSLDKLLFVLKILFSFFYKTSYSNEEVNRIECAPLQLVFPVKGLTSFRNSSKMTFWDKRIFKFFLFSFSRPLP